MATAVFWLLFIVFVATYWREIVGERVTPLDVVVGGFMAVMSVYAASHSALVGWQGAVLGTAVARHRTEVTEVELLGWTGPGELALRALRGAVSADDELLFYPNGGERAVSRAGAWAHGRRGLAVGRCSGGGAVALCLPGGTVFPRRRLACFAVLASPPGDEPASA